MFSLTQAAKRASDSFPKREEETDSRKRLLATTKGARILIPRAVLPLRGCNIIRLHFELKRFQLVIEEDLSVVATMRKVELEHKFASQGDVTAEFLPSSPAFRQRGRE